MAATATMPDKHTGTAHPVGTQPRQQLKLLVFELGDQTYALESAVVKEIVPMAELSRPACAPGMVAGFLNLGGRAVTVIRLGCLFGVVDRRLDLYTPLIVLRDRENSLALLVDRVDRIVTSRADEIVPVNEGDAFNDCVRGVVRIDGRLVLLLSPERILLDKERQCLAELESREQERLRQLEMPEP